MAVAPRQGRSDKRSAHRLSLSHSLAATKTNGVDRSLSFRLWREGDG